MTTLYLAGPMSGIAHCNYPLFDHLQRLLEGCGFTVISPAQLNRTLVPGIESTAGHISGLGETTDPDARARFMKNDIDALQRCDAIALMPGWEDSIGANAERFVAETIGMPILYIVETADGYRLMAEGTQPDYTLEDAQVEDAIGALIDEVVAHEGEMGEARTFESGATRDTDEGKFDYEGYLSPLVLVRYAEYMYSHGSIADEPRPSDNWQKGIPLDAYMKSAWRHFMDVWLMHRGYDGESTDDLEEAICATLFNLQGMLHELVKETE